MSQNGNIKKNNQKRPRLQMPKSSTPVLNSKQFFREVYKPHITTYVHEYHITESFLTIDELKDNWQPKIDLSFDTASDLLLHTKIFLRLAEHRSITDPGFLKAVITYISNYLAEYFKRFEIAQTDRKRQLRAKEKVQKILFDDFKLVQDAIQRVEDKRAAKKETKDAIRKNKYRKGSNKMKSSIPAEAGNIKDAKQNFIRVNIARDSKTFGDNQLKK